MNRTSPTPRDRVEQALRRELPEQVPFTTYESKLPQCAAERSLRNRGLCIVHRRNVFQSHFPNVTIRQETFAEGGRRLTRTHYGTPVGALSTLEENAGFTTWFHERMFKTPDDYRALRFLIRDEVDTPDYAAYARTEADFGGDAICRAGFGLEPLQALISGQYLGMTDFCLEWMDRRDEVLKLYEALVENRRRRYALVAESPASHANYGGNVVPAIVGPELFETYYLPHYQEAAEAMHRAGKWIGSHFDDDCRLLAPSIAKTDLDYIEAFTPAPGTDLTLAEARRAWPDKVLWLNFPSVVHLQPDAEVERTTVALLDEVESVEGLIMGITEDIPPARWRGSCRAIQDGLERHVRLHPERYASGLEGRGGE